MCAFSHISGHVSVVSKTPSLEKAGLMNEDGTPTQTALDTPGVVLNDDGKVTGILMETKGWPWERLVLRRSPRMG